MGGGGTRAVSGRSLGLPGWLAVILVYLAIIQGLGLLIGVDTGDDQFPTAESVVRGGLIPIAVSMLYAAGVATWLGWWPAIVRSDKPVQSWLWFLPISMIVAALLAVDYANLADQTAGLVLATLAMTLCVGITEELMFRGIGVEVLRRHGLTEGKVALYSSLIFGAVHLSNAVGAGPHAILQAAAVATTGYFFYLMLRVSGVILLPMLVHALWDFSLLSPQLGPDPEGYAGSLLVILLQVVLIVLLLARRHRIEPAPLATTAVAPAPAAG